MVLGGVKCGGNTMVEALVSVGSEVNGEGGFGGHGAGDFDGQHDFAIGAVGITGGFVMRTVHRDGYDLRRSHFQSVLEVGLNVLWFEAAAQFNDGDALAGAVGVRGEIVELRNLHGSERAGRLRSASMRSYGWLVGAKMRPRLLAVVEAKDCGDEAVERRGNIHGSGAAAIGSIGSFVVQQLDVKGFAEVC